jgi:hypothetical protein
MIAADQMRKMTTAAKVEPIYTNNTIAIMALWSGFGDRPPVFRSFHNP